MAVLCAPGPPASCGTCDGPAEGQSPPLDAGLYRRTRVVGITRNVVILRRRHVTSAARGARTAPQVVPGRRGAVYLDYARVSYRRARAHIIGAGCGVPFGRPAHTARTGRNRFSTPRSVRLFASTFVRPSVRPSVRSFVRSLVGSSVGSRVYIHCSFFFFLQHSIDPAKRRSATVLYWICECRQFFFVTGSAKPLIVLIFFFVTGSAEPIIFFFARPPASFSGAGSARSPPLPFRTAVGE